MTNQQKIKALAEKAMGWKEVNGFDAWIPADAFYIYEDHIINRFQEWNPLTNPADCADLRERIYEKYSSQPIRLFKIGAKYFCRAINDMDHLDSTGPTEAAAVVEFAVKLWGIE